MKKQEKRRKNKKKEEKIGGWCSTTKLSVLLTSTLGTIKNLIINCSNKAFENSGINYFWSVKNSLEVLDQLHVHVLVILNLFKVLIFLPYIPLCLIFTHLIKLTLEVKMQI